MPYNPVESTSISAGGDDAVIHKRQPAPIVDRGSASRATIVGQTCKGKAARRLSVCATISAPHHRDLSPYINSALVSRYALLLALDTSTSAREARVRTRISRAQCPRPTRTTDRIHRTFSCLPAMLLHSTDDNARHRQTLLLEMQHARPDSRQ